MLHQPGFDFAQFNAQTAQLDLMVETAQVFDDAIGALAHAVTGTVQPRADMERARHKTLGGERRTPMVTACETRTTQVQLAGHARRHRGQLRIQHMGAQVGDRLANRHAVGALVDAGPVSHVDCRLGRAVKVVQPGLRQLGEHLQLRVQRQRFTAANDAFETAARHDARLVNKRLEHRRDEVQRGDVMSADGLDQPRRLTVLARRRHHQTRAAHQWPEEFPDRNVETERGLLQHCVALIQRIGLLHPAQAVDQRGVTAAGPFGLPVEPEV